MKERLLFMPALLLSLGISTGCGSGASDMPELGSVHGKVTLDGQLLSGVNVIFNPVNGRP